MKQYESVAGEEWGNQLRDDLRAGRIPERFLYMGDEGAKNWLRLERSGEYWSMGNIAVLLRKCAPSLRRFVAPETPLVSIGVGSGEMERVILSCVGDSGRTCYAVGISARLVDVALGAVDDPSVKNRGIVGRFEDLPALSRIWGHPSFCCVLGCRFSHMEPGLFFHTLSGGVTPEDTILFDSRFFPDATGRETIRGMLEQSVRSRHSVRFHLYPLIRYGLRPDDCELRIELVPVSTEAGVAYCAKKSIRLRVDCSFSFGSLRYPLQSGDELEMGSLFLFRRDQVERLAHRYGFEILDLHESPESGNLVIHARKRK